MRGALKGIYLEIMINFCAMLLLSNEIYDSFSLKGLCFQNNEIPVEHVSRVKQGRFPTCHYYLPWARVDANKKEGATRGKKID